MTRFWKYALIALVAWLAHHGALQAEFFMDDYGHLLASPAAIDGQWWAVDWRWLPYFIWHAAHSAAGFSGPVFHALNLAVHTSLACILYRVGGDFLEAARFPATLECRRLAALLGALIFACHPLGTEAVHYARCLMIGLVSLFGVLAAWGTLRFAREGSTRWALLALASVGFAAASKNPGLIHAGCGVVIVAAACLDWTSLRQDRRVWLWTGLLAALAVAWAGWWMRHIGPQANFFPHTLTQGRLFWGYLARVAWPMGQSADHWTPWSTSGRDFGAIAGLTGVFLLVAAGLWLSIAKQRRRIWGALLLLAIAPLLARFGYVVHELMVEYRLYPALPWMALIAGAGLAWIWAKFRILGPIFAAGILVCCVLLSRNRSNLWQDVDLLWAESIARYPANVRAWTGLQFESLLREDWNQALGMMPSIDRAFQLNLATTGGRVYLRERALDHYARAHRNAAYALRERDGVRAALEFADQALEKLAKLDGANQHPNALSEFRQVLAAEAAVAKTGPDKRTK